MRSIQQEVETTNVQVDLGESCCHLEVERIEGQLMKVDDIGRWEKVERYVLVIRRGRYNNKLKQRMYRLTWEKVVVT